MYAKLKDGKISQFPYTIGQLRKDNPNVSFPKNITSGVLQKYGIIGVVEGPQPECGPYQTIVRDTLPTRPIIRYTNNEDARNPVTGDIDLSQVGLPVYANYWMIGYTATDMFSDTTDENGNVTTKAQHEAAYQATLDVAAAQAARDKRNTLLAESDWTQVDDAPVDKAAWAVYRQALRDITSQAEFPHNVVWPTKPE